MVRTKLIASVWLVCSSLALVCYFQGIDGPFLLDDFTNLNRLYYLDGTSNGLLLAIFGHTSDLLGRPISYLSFVINYQGWPDDPSGFKLTNILLHIVTAGLILLFVTRLPSSVSEKNKPFFVIFVFSAWLLSPLQVSSVLYVVQRMTQLSALFVVLGLLFYVEFRRRDGVKRYTWLMLCAACSALGYLSKQNGLLVLPLIGLLELYLRSSSIVKREARCFEIAIALASFAYFALFLFYVVKFLPSFDGRAFTALERIMIQGAVVWDYLYLSFVPDVNYMSLHHDGYQFNTTSKSVVASSYWLIHVSLLASAVYFWRKNALYGLGICWFYLAHSMESTLLPLELMFEHRNYFPSIGLYISTGALLCLIFNKISEVWSKSMLAMLLSLFFIPFLFIRASYWGNEYSIFLKWNDYKVESARSKYAYAGVLEKAGFGEAALEELRSANERFERLGFQIYAWRLQCMLGKNYDISFPSAAEIQSSNFTSDVLFEFEQLVNRWRSGECVPNQFSERDVQVTVESFLSMQLLRSKKGFYAKMLEAAAKFYEDAGWLDLSADAYIRLYESQPTIDTALRNAEFALRLGLDEYATEFIDKARKHNRYRAADRSVEIQALEERLLEL